MATSVLAFACLLAVHAAVTANRAHAQGRVVGGQAVQAQEFRQRWPFLVALEIDGSGPACGGTLVGRATVVTAAHCVVDLQTGATIGAPRVRVLAMSSNVARAVPVPVRRVFVSPEWNVAIAAGDVAVLQLAAPVGARPIEPVSAGELALTGAGDGVAVSSSGPRVAGWGMTDPANELSLPLTAREASMPIASDAACSSDEQPGLGMNYIPSAMLCAGIPNSTDSCLGDSGGPLVVTDGAGATRLAGVVSFGSSQCASNMYAAYSRVSTYAAWIGRRHSPQDAFPTAPRTVRVSVVGSRSVRLSWSAATDDEGVTGYVVTERAGRGWMVVGRPRGLSFVTSVAPGVHRYAIAARDAQGHVSVRAELAPLQAR